VALIVILGFAAALVWMRSDMQFCYTLKSASEAAIGGGKPIISISSTTHFRWDKLLIFAPYTSVERIYVQLGFKWDKAEKTCIQSSKNFYLMVFVKDQKVVRFIKVPRSFGEFKNLEIVNLFPQGNDYFEVRPAPMLIGHCTKRYDLYPVSQPYLNPRANQ
jgi:hypothetical protein